MKSSVVLLVLLIFGLGAVWFGYREISAVKRSAPDLAALETEDGENPNGIPELGAVPDFELIGLDSAVVTAQSYAGKVWVVDFIFTTCAGPCPKMTKNMAGIHQKFLGKENFKLVSVTVDPEYDTRQILHKYAASFQADTSRWQFLTGSIEAIENFAVKGLKLPGDVHVATHSSFFVLVDSRGELRGYYNGLKEEDMRKLAGHVEILLKEMS